MRPLLCIALLLVLSLISSAQFQPRPVEKSQKIMHYQGKAYYMHTVEKGHTLYSICKAYQISEDELAKANPGVILSPLSVGQVLRIPSVEEGVSETDTATDTKDTKFIYHTVVKDDNVFSLSKRYGVSKELIYHYNPSSRLSIQLGQTLKIPITQNIDSEPTQGKLQPEPETRYMVRQGDTLYRIAKTYGISIDELIKKNPELRWGLKAGQYIIIPQIASFDYYAVDAGSDSIITISAFKSLSKYQCDSVNRRVNQYEPVKVALMMPFMAKQTLEDQKQIALNDTLAEDVKERHRRLRGQVRVSAEFYEGFLLAVDSLRQSGHNISLFVYDTEEDTNRVKEILKELEIVEPDVIIGPLHNDNIRLVSQFSFERKIPFVPPLTESGDLSGENPFLFCVMPSTQSEIEAYSSYLAKQFDKNIVLAYKNNLKYREEVENFKRLFLEKVAASAYLDTLHFNEVFINDTLQANLDKALRTDKKNLVVILSTYEPDANRVLSHLHFLLRHYEIAVFGMPSWQKFDNVRIEVLHELQATVYTPFYINYSDEAVNNFVQECRKTLGYEPFMTSNRGTGINYTYFGYDMGMYFIDALSRYSNQVCNCAHAMDQKLLLSDYQFERNPQNGVNQNTSIRFLNYNKEYILEEIVAP